MSFIQNFYTSRDNNTDGNTYVGQEGRLWYNPDTNSIYVNTANVAGGTPVDLATGANAAFNGITVNTIGTDDSSVLQFITDVNFNEFVSVERDLTVSGNIVVTGNISAAAVGKIGGITPGPGVNISNAGILTIDSANLEFSFGNFTANNNILTIVNADEDMILATQGDATIKLVGNVEFVQTNGPPGTGNIFISATNEGFMTIYAPAIPANAAGALNVVGSSDGAYQPVTQSGGMIHVTGNDNTPSRITNDGYGANGIPTLVSRRSRGTPTSPAVVESGDVISRYAYAGWTGTVFGHTTGGPLPTSIDVVATENFTGSTVGTEMRFYNAPTGGSTRTLGATITANGISTGNVTVTGNIGNVDVLQFDTAANISLTAEGSLSWNATDKTLNIQHPNSVTQQVGQEFYAVTENITGNEIVNGSVVGFTGAMTNDVSRMTVAPFIANGSTPTLTALGVTTQAIANGTSGFTTMVGVVRGIDTTGNAASETWNQGDILYASPTVAGGFTNVKPTAPNNVVPVAAILNVDATDGEIFVRPSYEIQKNYGSFYSTQDQTLGAINTAANITFNNTGPSQQISMVNNSEVTFADSGFYTMTVDYQLVSTNASAKNVYFWYARDGNNVDNTTRVVTLTGSGEFKNVTITYNISVEANTYVQFRWAADSTAVTLDAMAATAFAPSSPSVQLDISQTAL